MKDKKSNDVTVDVQPRSFGTVRFGSRSMPALAAALILGLVSSITMGVILAGFMPQTIPWLIKALIVAISILSGICESLVGHFGGSRYLAWCLPACRREYRESLVRKGRAAFIPHFHRVGVGRLPAGQFDGS